MREMKIQITKLDSLFSKFIRQRDKVCQRCGKGGRLETSHFHGRRKRSVRWDEDNAVALCFACHRYFTENPLEHCEWFKNRLGEKEFDALNVRARINDHQDLDILADYYEKLLRRN